MKCGQLICQGRDTPSSLVDLMSMDQKIINYLEFSMNNYSPIKMINIYLLLICMLIKN